MRGAERGPIGVGRGLPGVVGGGGRRGSKGVDEGDSSCKTYFVILTEVQIPQVGETADLLERAVVRRAPAGRRTNRARRGEGIYRVARTKQSCQRRGHHVPAAPTDRARGGDV
eukprot:1175707-Prorocentrum_minimum.AAC.2